MAEIKMVSCCTCGYEWQHGRNGSHSCTQNMWRTIEHQAAEIERLRDALKQIKSDLFLQIESRHGPRAASEYPSIVRANEALEVRK